MLKNLKALRNDMIKKMWIICSFIFQYKKIKYIVLVERFLETEKENKYALVKLHFMKEYDLNDALQVETNSCKLLIDAKRLREYFGIEYQENLGIILEQFTAQLGNAIPETVPICFSAIEKKAMVHSLSKSDSEDPDKIYCNNVRRNPEGSKRSIFNENKTRLLRPLLFEHFRNDPTISFCYYTEPAKENDDAAILKNFAEQ